MTGTPQPLTQDRSAVTISSMPGNWTSLSGGDSEREVTKQRPAAAAPEATYTGRLKHNDVTTVRMYEDPAQCAALVRRLQRGDAFPNTTITVQDLDADDVPIPGAKIVRTGCVVKSFSPAEADANSSDGSKLTIVWTVGGVA